MARASSGPRSGSGSRSRSSERDEEARAKLEPLAPGERPVAVTVAAVGASLFALLNLVALVLALMGQRPLPPRQLVLQALVAVLLMAIAAGAWRSRYWAVLGVQTLLAVQIVFEALRLFLAGGLDLRTALSVLIIAAAGTLFWFLVRAMARLQMPAAPERPVSGKGRA